MADPKVFLSSLQKALEYRQDLENGNIWAKEIYSTPSGENHLYLGNGYHARNYEQLQLHSVKYILNCTDDVPNYYEQNDDDGGDRENNNKTDEKQNENPESISNQQTPWKITYLKLDIKDFGLDKGISRIFPIAANFVNNSFNHHDGNILIHCANGCNRSVTVAIAILMIINGWNLSQAWNHIIKIHPQAAPLRDNRHELLKFEFLEFHKNSMFESNTRLLNIPILSGLKNIKIRLATGSLEEAAQCLKIYTPIVYDTTITFEIIPPTVEEFATRMIKCMEKFPWLLAYDRDSNEIIGYAYAGIFKERAAYRWSVESSIYISSLYPRCGIATKLYDTLFTFLMVMNIVNVVAVIALPNEASVKLHEKYDFKTVGIFSNIGYKHEKWIDVIYMQKTLQEPQYLAIGDTINTDIDEQEELEREVIEPISYPDCSHKLHEILKLME